MEIRRWCPQPLRQSAALVSNTLLMISNKHLIINEFSKQFACFAMATRSNFWCRNDAHPFIAVNPAY